MVTMALGPDVLFDQRLVGELAKNICRRFKMGRN